MITNMINYIMKKIYLFFLYISDLNDECKENNIEYNNEIVSLLFD